MGVIRVFSGDSSRPRSRRNCSTSGWTSSSRRSFVRLVMMKSSAYRTRLTCAWRLLAVAAGYCSRSRCSKPSRARFAFPGGNDPSLGSARLRLMEDVLVHVSRLQPLPEDGFVHGDVGQEPVVADLVEAGFDVPFEDPCRRVPVGQHGVALLDRVGAAPFFPKSIGVRVGGGF